MRWSRQARPPGILDHREAAAGELPEPLGRLLFSAPFQPQATINREAEVSTASTTVRLTRSASATKSRQ
jgi:hypothetical protein